ncbi:MAG: cellulase family glycosylhydrolase [Pseudonocardiaceae bacterium]|nr:cellulase family glycosylhydrolase [Pseudonocardiaceae bacterium]
MDGSILLRTRGSQLVTGEGDPVVLRGVGLGGWMNMENFITGYSSTESVHRHALRKVLGGDDYEAFFERFLDVFFTEEDAAFLASLGLNCVRIPVNYRHFEDDMAPFELHESGFARLDRVVQACAGHGLYSIIDLHALPGFQNQHWHSDNPTHWSFFWTHRHFQDRVVNLWEALADRYRENPWVAGYNPINEPGDVSGTVIGPFYERLQKALRGIDPEHILFLDGNRYSTEFGMFGEPLPNTIYTVHDYALPGFVDGGPYPGTSRGRHVDRDVVEETFLERTRFMRETGTPIWVGEFGPVYTGDPDNDEQRYRLLADQLEIYRRYAASWSIWTYKDIGLQGLVYTPEDSPYLRRIESVVARKRRLGVDAWGGLDNGVRHILDPIEETFAKEYPDFDPFPFGQKKWIDVLVRHILLAEPLADEYARCFAGLSRAALLELADSFRFTACVRRGRLAEILKDG